MKSNKSEIPEFSRQSKGLPIINLLPIEKDEKINSILLDNGSEENKYLVVATKNGLIKRTNVCEFENIRKKVNSRRFMPNFLDKLEKSNILIKYINNFAEVFYA